MGVDFALFLALGVISTTVFPISGGGGFRGGWDIVPSFGFHFPDCGLHFILAGCKSLVFLLGLGAGGGVSFVGSSACVWTSSPSFPSDSSSVSGTVSLGGAGAPPTAPSSLSLTSCSGGGVALLVFLTVVAISSACTGRGLTLLPSLSVLQFWAICPGLPQGDKQRGLVGLVLFLPHLMEINVLLKWCISFWVGYLPVNVLTSLCAPFTGIVTTMALDTLDISPCRCITNKCIKTEFKVMATYLNTLLFESSHFGDTIIQIF